MYPPTFLRSLLLCAAAAATAAAKPYAILLAGDSTTAPGGGWGDGFLSTTLNAPSFATNFAKGGTTTSSFRAGGYWGNLLAAAEGYAEEYEVLVTIQFGHNDQKLTDYEATFKENLATMVDEVRAAGGTPVLVSSLSRRNFNSDGTVNDILAPWAGYTLGVAAETGAASVDLWAESVAYLEKIGVTAARRMDLASGDHTHLNVQAGVVFGRMVSDLLGAEVPAVVAVTRANETMSAEIREGVPSM
ncbi:SGNH hydrolase-type esterase domain-containing protein [Geopyxis carbonaria]|nr:SGNH hydrolase-type esterase domain-containing protein [Geopyxis carbonaria]